MVRQQKFQKNHKKAAVTPDDPFSINCLYLFKVRKNTVLIFAGCIYPNMNLLKL